MCRKPAAARGVVVICTHATFVKNTASLTERQSATNDNFMMKKIWKLYDDCEVLAFEDESSSFYDTELEEKSKWCVDHFLLWSFSQVTWHPLIRQM